MKIEFFQRALTAFETRKNTCIAIKWPKAGNGEHGENDINVHIPDNRDWMRQKLHFLWNNSKC